MDTGADDVGGAAIGVAGGGASAEFAVDESKPTTNVRVRLATGKRQVLKFNTTHTVADLLAQVARCVSVCACACERARRFPPHERTCRRGWTQRVGRGWGVHADGWIPSEAAGGRGSHAGGSRAS